MDLENIKNLERWEKWKETLARSVDIGEAVGLSDQTIEKIAVNIGNLLSKNVDPENREQRVLQELWRTADDIERRALAGSIIKMVQTGDRTH